MCPPAGAHQDSLRLLESSMAAPPTLNRQLGMSMDLVLPKYQFCVMFSVDTTSTYVLGSICSIWRARSTAMMPAADSSSRHGSEERCIQMKCYQTRQQPIRK
eukprot:GHRQ01040088.1.p1 GENE.GHRQ01040088.1~~GHRQ01040088.1.p1  ORF type:complete len:102 (+),score=24.22 GHRQ01040088.1:133-438(+)